MKDKEITQNIVEDFNEDWNSRTVDLKNAKGSRAARYLRSNLRGTLFVYKQLPGEDETLIKETIQPYLALQAYYEIDCGKIWSAYNDAE